MVALALEALGLTAEVEIHIEKRLPVQGGLGAGSANAVAALVGLEAELGLAGQQVSESASQRVSAEDWQTTRLEIAAQVGSDVPLFLIGGTVLGLDRGQEVYPLPDIEPIWCVVATPEVGVSTPQAFRDWDALCAAEGLTAEASTDKLNKLSRAYASAFAGAIPEGRQGAGSSGVPSRMRGNLAGPKSPRLSAPGSVAGSRTTLNGSSFPSILPLQKSSASLAASGTPEAALYASLSGSGSALFGLYLTRGDAEAACQRLEAAGVRSQLTRTLPRSKYWSECFCRMRG